MTDSFLPRGADARPVRSPPRPGPTFAALDLGTNNCRLLIARPAGAGFRIVDAFSRIVRLGEGMSATGCLSEDAMSRTIDALGVCAGKMRRREVTHSRAVATEACRRAANCAGFVSRVEAETGIALEIISAREEARLAFEGCAPLLDPCRPHAVAFDIGGGSTELGWLTVEPSGLPRLLDWLSIPIGVVTLAERYGTGRIAAEAYAAMIEEVVERLRPFEAANGIAQGIARAAVQMLGTSGTVTTLAGVHLGLARYDRRQVDGVHLDFTAIRAVSAALAGMDYEMRAASPCIGRERADLVVAGCAILEAICVLWPVGRLRVADRGVREGILVGLMAQAAATRRRHELPA
jgi:exopolyphosphatase/guanosine-5'-triphosphate,3'-diphosphate pyrophosphatase